MGLIWGAILIHCAETKAHTSTKLGEVWEYEYVGKVDQKQEGQDQLWWQFKPF